MDVRTEILVRFFFQNFEDLTEDVDTRMSVRNYCRCCHFIASSPLEPPRGNKPSVATLTVASDTKLLRKRFPENYLIFGNLKLFCALYIFGKDGTFQVIMREICNFCRFSFSREGFCRNPRGFFPNDCRVNFAMDFWWIILGLLPWKKENPPKNTARFKSEFGSLAAKIHTARICPWLILEHFLFYHTMRAEILTLVIQKQLRV